MLIRAVFLALLLFAAPAFAAPPEGPPRPPCHKHLSASAEKSLDLSAKGLYDLLLHVNHNFRSAVSLLRETSDDAELRTVANEALAKNRFARWAAAVGSRFRRRMAEYIAEHPARIPRQWIIEPRAALFKSYLQFKRSQKALQNRPISPAAARARAFEETKNSADVPPALRQEDLFRGSAAHFSFARHLVRREADEEPARATGQAALNSAREWLGAMDRRIRQYRERNMKQAIADFSAAVGPIYLQAMTVPEDEEDESHSRGSLALDAEALEKATVAFQKPPFSGLAVRMALRPALADAPIAGLAALFRRFGANLRNFFLNLGKRDQMYRSQRTLMASPNRNAWLQLPLDDTAVPIGFHAFFDFFEKHRSGIEALRQEDRDWIRQRLRIANEIDHSLELLSFEIKHLMKAPSLPLLERAMAREKRHESTRRGKHQASANTLLHAAAAHHDPREDLLEGVEWFGYGIEGGHWLRRDTQFLGQDPATRGFARRIYDAFNDRYSKLRLVSATAVGVAMIFTGSAAISAATIHLPKQAEAWGLFGGSGEDDALGNSSLTDPTNDGSESGNRILFNVRAPADHPPVVFDEAHTGEMDEDGAWEPVFAEEIPSGIGPYSPTDPDSVLLTSAVALRLDGQGRILVPVPGGYRVDGIEAQAGRGAQELDQMLRGGRDYEVLRHQRTGNYMVRLEAGMGSAGARRFLGYSVRMTPDAGAGRVEDSDIAAFNDLDGGRVLAIVDQLDDVGMETLVRKLRRLVEERRADGAPLTLRDLESVFAGTQIYTHEREAYFSIRSWFSDNPFMTYDRFLQEDGSLHYECDGANALFADFLRAYYAGDDNVVVENIRSHVAEYDDNAVGGIATGRLKQAHLRTLVSRRQGGRWASIMLDATATRQERPPESPRDETPPRPHAPDEGPDLVALPTERFRLQRPAGVPITPEGLERQRAEQEHHLRTLAEMRKALLRTPGYVDLLQDIRGGIAPPRRAAHLAKILASLGTGEKTQTEALAEIRELYPRLDIGAAEGLQEWNKTLASIQRAETIVMHRLARLSARSRHVPWFSNVLLQDRTLDLLRVIVSHHWLPPTEPPTGGPGASNDR